MQFRLICIGTSPADIRQMCACGEDRAFMDCSDQLIAELLCAYYVFDVRHPESMSGIHVCYFLQEVALKEKDNSYKGTKYSTFMDELRNELQL